MGKILFIIIIIAFSSCKTTSYYIVRHAQKEVNTMSSDVPLSDLGRQNADALRVKLANEKIEQVYSTNYARTRSTVQPIADQLNLKVQTYNPTDTVFFRQLRESKKNVLIAGHSNTVDDLVNYLLGYRKMNDLPDDQYEDLFIIRKKGKTFSLEIKKWKD